MWQIPSKFSSRWCPFLQPTYHVTTRRLALWFNNRHSQYHQRWTNYNPILWYELAASAQWESHAVTKFKYIIINVESQILKNSDFISYSFRKFIKADNTKVNVIVPSPDAEYILLGFENGQIILTKSAMLNCSLLDVTNHNLNLNSTTIINPSMINPSLINPSLINQPIT